MKLLAQHNGRRSNSFRGGNGGSSPLDCGTDEGGLFPRSTTSLLWLALHGLCCLISLVLGFRFSRLIYFLLLSPSATNYYTNPTPLLFHTSLLSSSSASSSIPAPLLTTAGAAVENHSRVVVGRHGIRIRPWPHPNPSEVVRAHKIIERVQKEQRIQYGVRSPRPVIAVTPTYARTFQALHLTGLMHSLMLVPYDLTWIVVEAGGISNDTAAILARSKLQVIHVPFTDRMPVEWVNRHQIEAKMRIHALRVVRQKQLDGIVVFADDSNMHSMELFDEIQKVIWFGAVPLGILAHLRDPNQNSEGHKNELERENSPIPIQGPTCNSSSKLIGWHTINTLPYAGWSAVNVSDSHTVLPTKLEWAGFVLNARLLWKKEAWRPDWVRDLDSILQSGKDIESPLDLLKDVSFVEPLGNCGRKVMLWWLRVEARFDSKFPSGWIIDPPLEITVPAKRTPWPDTPPELPSEKSALVHGNTEKRSRSRSSRSRRGSRGKRKRDSLIETQTIGVSGVSHKTIQEK